MPEERTARRLAAILAADVVGYSRMMGADEAGTLTALKRHRETVFDPAVTAHNGRIVKLIGDGTLVEFPSVVDAVACAMAIQIAAAAASNGSKPEIVLRIGVNLGDIIIDGDDIYGDGVNVAARLEPLAEPGGICVASIVNESVGKRVDVSFQDGGEVQVKNIDRPIRVWKWHPNGAASNTAPANAPSPVKAAAIAEPKASIAVLPFDNMSHDPEQEYFSDGISEDIITDLSKVAGLIVIARNSSFAYKGKAVDIRTVGRELGVRSVLEGSIRRAGNRVRINAQLINAADGAHIWAERYDRELTDIFEVQDEVTQQIVEALRINLSSSERARITEIETTNLEAHDYFLKGRELLSSPGSDRSLFDECSALFQKAIDLDPGYAAAYAALGFANALAYNNNWTGDPPAVLRKAIELTGRAIELAPDDPYAHYVYAVAIGLGGDSEGSRASTERALALNPSLAAAHNSRGAIEIFTGNPAAAIPHIEQAIRLDPASTRVYLHFLGLAHLLLGNYETAVAHFRERVREVPKTDLTRTMLASALGHLGEIDAARQVWDELMAINPSYNFEEHIGRLPFKNPPDPARIRAGIAKAGLPK